MSDFYNKYPYTDFHELNLDWIIERVKQLTEDWISTKEAWEGTEADWNELHDYVMNYFANLDVQDEINAKINAMIADGSFDAIITPIVESEVPGSVTDWLNTHVDPVGSAVIVDDTLSITGAAADAKVTGDLISTNRGNIENEDNFIGGQLSKIYSDHSIWTQGSFGAIDEYSAPLPNTSATRIRSEFVVGSGNTIHIKLTDADYEFIYAVFAKDGTLIVGTHTWQTSNKIITDDDSYYMRISIRKNDDSNITPDDYPDTGITVYSAGAINDRVDALESDTAYMQKRIDITDSQLNSKFTLNYLDFSVWQQGSYGEIIDFDNSLPNTASTRIKSEFIMGNGRPAKITLKDSDYEFIYALFDKSGNLIVGTHTWQDSNKTLNYTDMYYARISIRKNDDSALQPSDYSNLIIEMTSDGVIDDEITDLYNKYNSDHILTVASDNAVKKNFDRNYTDIFPWIQGGFGAIRNYSAPNINTSSTRIRNDFLVATGNYVYINHTDSNYEFTFALFDASNNEIIGTNTWQSNSKTLNYTNGYYLRINIRRSDNTDISPSDYPSTGITVTSNGVVDDFMRNINTGTKLKVMTYNLGRYSYGTSPYYINSDYDEKVANYKKFFSEEKCDLMGLQENNVYLDGVDSGTDSTNNVLFNYLYPYKKDTNNYVCLKSKYELTKTGTNHFSTERSYIYGTLKIDNKEIYLMCVHLTPNAGAEEDAKRAQEVSEIITICQTKERFIVFGDFNAQTTDLYDAFISAGFKLCNGGYLPFEWTYTFSPSDYSSDTPSANIRYFDNIVVSSNIIVDYSERRNVYADLTSDHIPFVAYLTIM